MLFVEGFSLFDVFYLADPIDIANTIRQVVGLISIERSIDRKALVDALLSREEVMSTAIGNGIAIPHVRLFDSMSLQEDIVAVAYLFEPVDWVAPDGKPVHTLFFVLAADETRHLQILAEIAQLASDEDFVEFLRTMPPRESLIERIQQLEEKVNGKEASNSQDS
ncbi:MAG TPA: PTS sugar transporter subunit IIA [Rectinema sp.]|nr:PTS sugar transporter subunit IIA [Rectinema sp.]